MNVKVRKEEYMGLDESWGEVVYLHYNLKNKK